MHEGNLKSPILSLVMGKEQSSLTSEYLYAQLQIEADYKPVKKTKHSHVMHSLKIPSEKVLHNSG